MQQRFKKFASSLLIKEVLFSAPSFLQFLYAIRNLWWGIGAYFFNLYFSVRALDYLTNNPISLTMLVLGLMGIYGVFTNKWYNYYINIVFALCNVFLFASIAITFFIHDPTSVAGVNYSLETMGAAWLVFRVQYDHSKEKRYVKFAK